MPKLFIILLVLFFKGTEALAWYQHQYIMQALAGEPQDSEEAKSRSYLKQAVKIPCLADEEKTIQEVAKKVLVNEDKIPRFSKTVDCSKTLTVLDLFKSNFVDEPDFGMDMNLPEKMEGQEIDHAGDRPYMGGLTGPTSQGFRHMFFPGMNWASPLRTLQYPTHKVGQAPDRFDILKRVSDQFFKDGNIFWGVRTLLWALHFMQDLHQPFHTRQILTTKFIPFKFSWSPFRTISQIANIVARTTHSVGNYHYAYEGLILTYTQDAYLHDFENCFQLDQTKAVPVTDILDVVKFSTSRAQDLGRDLYSIFDPRDFQRADYDLTRAEDPDVPDYDKIILSAEHEDAPKELKEGLQRTRDVSCELMKNLTMLTWGEFDRVFHYSSMSGI